MRRFPQKSCTARFSPFFFPVEPANSFGIAAQTLRKKIVFYCVEDAVKKLRKRLGKPADLLALRCAKHCGFPAGKRRISGG
jgi:hypothetical protein